MCARCRSIVYERQVDRKTRWCVCVCVCGGGEGVIMSIVL